VPHSAGDAGKTGAADPFAGLLDKLAQAVIIGAKVSCDYAIPAAPRGESFDRNKVNVLYSSGSKVQGDAKARIDVKFGCDTVILRPS
jgi:hypothetical protein